MELQQRGTQKNLRGTEGRNPGHAHGHVPLFGRGALGIGLSSHGVFRTVGEEREIRIGDWGNGREEGTTLLSFLHPPFFSGKLECKPPYLLSTPLPLLAVQESFRTVYKHPLAGG